MWLGGDYTATAEIENQEEGEVWATVSASPNFPMTQATPPSQEASPLEGPAHFKTQHVYIRAKPKPTAGGIRDEDEITQGVLGSQQEMVRVQQRFSPATQESRSSSQNVHVFRVAHMKKIQRQRLEESRKMSRSRKIVMLRKYRAGELPDVQITPRDVIQPMAALCKKDDIFAQITYVSLFKSILRAVPSKEIKRIKAYYKKYLHRVLESSIELTAPFVGCIHRICFEDDDSLSGEGKYTGAGGNLGDGGLRLAPVLIGETSLKSMNFHMGIMLLEKQVLQLQLRMQRNKECSRSKKSAAWSEDASELEESWSQLRRLYQSLGEHDILLGIQERHICTLEESKAALQHEVVGDYIRALEVYESVLRKLDSNLLPEQPTETEEQIWETGRLECFTRLGMWEDLAENTLAEVNYDAKRLWEPVLFLR